MFESILSSLKKKPAGDDGKISRRRYTRRNCDRCVSVIAGKAYPVEDWSIGGVLISGDSRLFALDQEYDVTLKFKLRNNLLDVPHKARVVRKNRNKIGMEFAPINDDIRHKFQSVVDDFVAAQFANSQRAY